MAVYAIAVQRRIEKAKAKNQRRNKRSMKRWFVSFIDELRPFPLTDTEFDKLYDRLWDGVQSRMPIFGSPLHTIASRVRERDTYPAEKPGFFRITPIRQVVGNNDEPKLPGG